MSAAHVHANGERRSGQSDDQQGKSAPASAGPGRTTTRITVNVGPSTEAALRTLMESESVTLTEAVRRLIGYGELIYRAIKIDGKDVLIRKGDETQQILLV